MKTGLQRFILTLLAGTLLSLCSCTQSPNGLQEVGGDLLINPAGPIDRPTLPVDSGPQIDCRIIRSDPEEATPEQIKACENVILPEDLPNARDAQPNIPVRLPPPAVIPNTGFPVRVIPTIEAPLTEITPIHILENDEPLVIERTQ